MASRPLGLSISVLGAVVLSACAGPGAGSSDASDQSVASPSASASEQAPSATPSGDGTASVAPPGATGGEYIDYTDGAIERTEGAKVLFFHAPWCPQCRKLDEQLLAEGAPEGMTVLKVDYDSRTDLRQRYGVTLQTTIVFVDDTGELLSSAVLYDDPSVASLIAAAP
ncbi:thioredoxin family protein [Microbacterium sulfonylureivorans]|uniref:thioredoxin family protein n=1 Tax=Microbacterium sulfonylureivorans TaxID=2486854 RepID=UPI000FDBD9E9|nr:thioredoxin family protein [Microbacterium sulfonylureivorans]